MTMMTETDPRFFHIEEKVGLFVVIAVVALVGLILFVGWQRGLFVPKTHLRFTAPSGQGLSEGMAVKLSGFKVGKVTRLELGPAAEVEGRIAIQRSSMHWVRADSHARLMQEGMLGAMVVDITPGTPAAAPMGEGAALPFARQVQMNEMIDALGDLKLLLGELRQGGIGETLANVRQLSHEMLATRAHLDHLLDASGATVTRVDGLVAQSKRTIAHAEATLGQLDGLVDQASSATGRAEGLFARVDREIPALMAKTDALLGELHQAAQGAAHASGEAPVLLDKTHEVLDETKEILDTIETLWPIRTHLQQGAPVVLPVHSDE